MTLKASTLNNRGYSLLHPRNRPTTHNKSTPKGCPNPQKPTTNNTFLFSTYHTNRKYFFVIHVSHESQVSFCSPRITRITRIFCSPRITRIASIFLFSTYHIFLHVSHESHVFFYHVSHFSPRITRIASIFLFSTYHANRKFFFVLHVSHVSRELHESFLSRKHRK